MAEPLETGSTIENTPPIPPATPEGEGGQPQDKTFSQADVDRIVTDRLARERNKMPSQEELDAVAAWKAEKQTEAEKHEQMKADFAALQAKNATLETTAKIRDAGIPKELVKYAMTDIQEAGDVDAGIAAFIASDLYKNSAAVISFGAPKQITTKPTTESAQLKADYDAAAKSGNRVGMFAIKRVAAEKGIQI
jgi:hypothetical protein